MKRESKEFFSFLEKLSERLIIIVHHNPAQGVDPCETDVQLLEELYGFYEKTSVPWVKDNDNKTEEHIQTSIV